MSVVYIVYARFSWLSFERQERYVLPTAAKMKSITEKLDAHIAKELSRIKREAASTSRLNPVAKVSIFMSSAVVVVLAVAVYLFLSVIRKVFVNLLIGWKGMALGSLSVMFGKFFQLIVQLTGAFHIPFSVVEVVLYPFALICGLLDLFNIDSLYSLMVVTCQGAKSPIELFIDSFVLGVAILFIESKYNFLWAMSLQEMNKAFLVKYWIEGRKILSLTFTVYSTAFVLSSTNPFITMLRFLLSFVNFGSFFVNNHLTHFLSQACVGIDGFQNQELWLVDATSVLVWWLLPPMLYMTAEIVCPKGGYTTSRASDPFLDSHRASLPVTPLTTPHSDMTDDSFSIGSLIVSDIDSDSSSHGIGSVFVSEETPENDSDHHHDGASAIAETTGHAYGVGEGDGNSSIGSIYDSETDDVSLHASRPVDIIIRRDSDFSIISHLEEIDRAGSRHSMSAVPTESQNAGRSTEPSSQLSSPSPFAPRHSIATLAIGMLRSMWSYVWLAFSIDLLIVHTLNAWVTRCQKLYDLEQLLQLRASQRWGLQAVQQSIHRFRTQRLHSSSWGHQYTEDNHSSRAVRDGVVKKWYHLTHQLEPDKLPPYYRLCFLVQRELFRKLQYLQCHWVLSLPVSYIVAFSGVGHLCAVVGRQHWGIAVWKYYLFLCVCLGFWTDESYEAFEIEDLVQKFTILDPDEATILFIPLTVASRVILLQVLGSEATLISIIVINLCGSPLFVFSPKLLKIIPPLIHFSPREVALKRETIELLGRRDVDGYSGAVHMQEWVIALRSVSIVLTESRLIVFFANLVSLSLAVMLLKDITLTAAYLSLCLLAMLPYFVGSALIPIIYIGKRLNLTDDDFRAVLPNWVLGTWVGLAELCVWLRSQLSQLFDVIRSMSVGSLFEIVHGRRRRVDTFPETNNGTSGSAISVIVDNCGYDTEANRRLIGLYARGSYSYGSDGESADNRGMVDEEESDYNGSIPDVSEEDLDDEGITLSGEDVSDHLWLDRSESGLFLYSAQDTIVADDVSVDISFGSIDASDDWRTVKAIQTDCG